MGIIVAVVIHHIKTKVASVVLIIKDFIKGNRTQVTERQEIILFMIADDKTLTSQKIAQKAGVLSYTGIT